MGESSIGPYEESSAMPDENSLLSEKQQHVLSWCHIGV